MLTRIVLAIDGSDASNRAIPLAAEFARRFGAEVVVFHAHEHAMGRAAKVDDIVPDDEVDLADHVVRWLKDEGFRARSEIRSCYFGHIAHELTEVARDEGADLIVLGARGLSDLDGLALGSVAEKTLHLSPISVLVVR